MSGDFMVFLAQSARQLFLYVVLVMSAVSALADESDFPVPDSIRPAIAFWIKVYTQADTESGFLHDSQNLNIIYQKLRRDKNLIEDSRNEIIANLKVLASGKRKDLSTAQQELLTLWGRDTANERFELASQSVRWQLGQSDRYQEGLIRSGAYRSHINNVVRSKNMPLELGALPHVESSFHPGAYSSVAASGMWQFMRETAQRFMQVDLVVDERLDPYTSTNAAMELLKYNYDALGTWPLALTAYNHGTNGMARAVRETGTRDIGRIISEYKGSRFGFASRNFYPQFLAALEVERKADQYFGKLQLHAAPEFAIVEMNGFVDVTVIAAALNVDVQTLRQNNPALLSAIWSGNKRIPKGYKLKIDKARFSGNLQSSINSIAAVNFYTAQIPDVSYEVRSGDSLSVIARRFETSVSELVAINQLRDRHVLKIGQTLVLPQKNGVVPTLIVNDVTTERLPDNGKYSVRRGDTISVIARRFEVSPQTLLALNDMQDGNLIYPGQELLLKAAATAVAVAKSPTPASQSNTAVIQPRQAAVTPAATTVADELAVLASDTGDQEESSLELAADPGDFLVASDNSIEIMAEETLGHYAGWLQMNSSDLRKLNGLKSAAAVKVGARLVLQFSKVNKAAFEQKRKQYHSELQAQYFAAWRIRETERYSIKNRDFLMALAQKRSIPMWLFRQYNPEVDVAVLQIGQVVVFPVVEKITN